jgi:tRNA(Ile)-lysidine synthase
MTSAARRLDARWLLGCLRELLGTVRGRAFCVAFSGGADSSVLLSLLASLRRSSGFALRAVHIHHHLQPQADVAATCAAQAAQALHVPFELRHVHIDADSGQSVEAAARSARYAELDAVLQANEVLVTAHHMDDQLETVLLALMRGAGVAGLAAMPALRRLGAHWHVRPLLSIGREQIVRCAQTRKLTWVEDRTNADVRFDRNYLRRHVLPLLYERWPAAALTASRSAAHLAEAQGLLDEVADAQLRNARDGSALRASALRRLALPARRNVLRRWLRSAGVILPDHRRLRQIATSLLDARADALPVVSWEHAEVRRHGDRVLLVRLPVRTPTPELQWDWRREPRLALPDGGALGWTSDPHGRLNVAALPPLLSIRYRRGGERLRAAHGRTTLKSFLQALRLAPWQRDAVPLLFAGAELIGVADLWLDEAYVARAGLRERARLRWQPNVP